MFADGAAFYNAVKMGYKQNIPGTRDIYDELKRRFSVRPVKNKFCVDKKETGSNPKKSCKFEALFLKQDAQLYTY